ncbi:MAG: type II toxin-antitoxin system RelE/ParE family toxin [Pseudanabaena sp. M57BS1SP1A06MG]|jgi:mRNA-degrading endonuclease RelE of RelBE toxin-antitoxin system|nr:type II toxin-antitoxin system RelE/ParE family toxin [Pseudanabaena sp. M53BS1SP1A06MG]MCA6583550.1 type II toxin-antitoxin system RelE/ParE family toxin [Pseudanabaena sp. M34BS1SP1A06MG]MCA6593091.1 type II toxin-antitoxin system RelE/ParE family toxin [Pseudanabaena sp. M38BS1SP1A06MG]MCA6597981.1 type II toxin-antitoxin system RelE/ParE family toxin [Pseudanabaena sp. M046S1SP1A06QC]MCA6601001.1 type II toxin-antitoxin system RelE/ParE family toxin [Pseudanabaena sp. M57BS1SP1A06MG]
MGEIQVFQTPLFSKIKKKLKKNQIKDLDNAVREIIKNPEIGEQKKGDLADVWVYKFRMVDRENLLAYQWDEKTRTLISLGVHENFYRDIKKYKNF